MDTKKFLIGTVAGGITYFILGYVFYGLLFLDFFESNTGSATGVFKTDDMIWWALAVGNFAAAALFTMIFLKWAHISTFMGGFKAGGNIGLFLTLSYSLVGYGTSNIMNLNGSLMDVAVGTVIYAIMGGVIGAVLQANSDASPASA